ncbi:SMC-Scp complex subunit ScpB [Xanthobacter autotrophicus]|jgi:segregation and condensation protein B|uniref:SMC-Scp complex subunit ScpB n=1 Tax=Xanthobacter autotrophicus TaxID=280 RepID=UPI001E4AC389|nr:SMC-Scp complex subunit ScpB [Xanthobacter autotrophicus]UDQ88472.1 SMC-Scp complex subunit ScpB [Xanthobacter autotrophicus]HML45091.1 SMC-Scp complex subunit ScpB [Hyphomicrobium zavarzinii]
MARRRRAEGVLDTELAELPPELRWREWVARVEAVIFAAPGSVERETLARVVGRDCNIELVIDDIRESLRGHAYDLAAVAGGWQLRTRPRYADAIHAALGSTPAPVQLSQAEMLVLACIAYHQPVTRGELGDMIGKQVSRDTIGYLRSLGFIVAGPRSPQPGAPYTYVTTKGFLAHFGLDTLRDLPDMEMLEDAGLLSKDRLLADDIPLGHMVGDGDEEGLDGDDVTADEPYDLDGSGGNG